MDGFRGGAEGATASLFFLCFQNVLRFCFENRFIKCSLILSSETLTLLYFASWIRSQCCKLHVLKSEVFIPGGWGEFGPLFLNFLDTPLLMNSHLITYVQTYMNVRVVVMNTRMKWTDEQMINEKCNISNENKQTMKLKIFNAYFKSCIWSQRL